MKNLKGRSFVTITIIVGVFALLLSIAIKQIIKINILQNESNASATLKLISAALENYSADHKNAFPATLSVLTKTNPLYLDKDYIAKSPVKGYNYSCPRMEPSGYSCTAVPVKCLLTGKIIYTIITGGLLTSRECK